ncbi:MAG: ferredoxin family protein [Gemmataceae bacterium]|nr:ferredoxin family protein [Gemmataceae bacterium]
MSQRKLNVVLSQAQGKDPLKRGLEEEIAAALLLEPGIDLGIVAHLYDLESGHTGRLFLESLPGDMVVLSWLYPRAAYWLLDRNEISGNYGENQLSPPAEVDEEEESEASPAQEKSMGIGSAKTADRVIYCLDMRDSRDFRAFVEEIRRILKECRQRWSEAEKIKQPAVVQLGIGILSKPANGTAHESFPKEGMLTIPARRWYPVIDYSRCTNCLECLDFCLFGVYGVDSLDRIYVDNQDQCKKGCPACSRVCPEQAIMFPDYKSPAIAGAPVGSIGGLKIDLTKLFGGGDALVIAAQERDKELVRDGRSAVGLTVGIPKRQEGKADGPKDDIDNLMDALDNLD